MRETCDTVEPRRRAQQRRRQGLAVKSNVAGGEVIVDLSALVDASAMIHS